MKRKSKVGEAAAGDPYKRHHSRARGASDAGDSRAAGVRGVTDKGATDLGSGGGSLKSYEAAFMCGALSLTEKRASEIMTPLSDVFCLKSDAVLNFATMGRIARSGHSRIPVFSSEFGRGNPRELAAESAAESAFEARHGRRGEAGVRDPNDEGGPSTCSTTSCRVEHVMGLLSTKDLMLVDPESAMPVGDLLKHCARRAVCVSAETPVAQLFRDFKRSRSHLALVQQGPLAELEAESRQKHRPHANIDDAAAGGYLARRRHLRRRPSSESLIRMVPEIVGIVTLEDVLEELMQTEIVDEDDLVVDNVSKKRVEVTRRKELERTCRLAFLNMLDPQQLDTDHLSADEIEALAMFLIKNVPAFRNLGSRALAMAKTQLILYSSRIFSHPGTGDHPALVESGEACSACIVVLHGRIRVQTQCNHSEQPLECEQGPWTILARAALLSTDYVPKFCARVVMPSCLLELRREHYEAVRSGKYERLSTARSTLVTSMREFLLTDCSDT